MSLIKEIVAWLDHYIIEEDCALLLYINNGLLSQRSEVLFNSSNERAVDISSYILIDTHHTIRLRVYGQYDDFMIQLVVTQDGSSYKLTHANVHASAYVNRWYGDIKRGITNIDVPGLFFTITENAYHIWRIAYYPESIKAASLVCLMSEEEKNAVRARFTHRCFAGFEPTYDDELTRNIIELIMKEEVND